MINKKIRIIGFLAFVLIMIFSVLLFSSSRTKIYIITVDKGILVSDNGGKSWDNFNKGLPANCIPVRLYTSGNDLFLTTFSSGSFCPDHTTTHWPLAFLR